MSQPYVSLMWLNVVRTYVSHTVTLLMIMFLWVWSTICCELGDFNTSMSLSLCSLSYDTHYVYSTLLTSDSSSTISALITSTSLAINWCMVETSSSTIACLILSHSSYNYILIMWAITVYSQYTYINYNYIISAIRTLIFNIQTFSIKFECLKCSISTYLHGKLLVSIFSLFLTS